MQYYNYAHSNDSNDTYDDSDTNEYWIPMIPMKTCIYLRSMMKIITTKIILITKQQISLFNRYNFNSNQKIIITIKIQTT
jgi:hypothetical protein